MDSIRALICRISMDLPTVEDGIRNLRINDFYANIPVYDGWGLVLLGSTVAGVLLFLCYHAVIRWLAKR